MDNKEIREFLYKQDAKAILKSVSPHLLGMIDMPFIFPDGYVIPETGYDVLKTGKNVNKVPLMIGSNTDEMKLFIYFSKEPDWKDSIYTKAAKYTSDIWKAVGADQIARKLSNLPDQPPVYLYLFNFGHTENDHNNPMSGKWGRKLGAHHMSEIKFFLGTDKARLALLSLTNRNKYKNGRSALTEAMMSYAKNLLYYDDPNYNKEVLPDWKAWSNKHKTKGIIFDADENKLIIKELNYELYPEKIVKEMKNKLSKEELETVNNFMFIFK